MRAGIITLVLIMGAIVVGSSRLHSLGAPAELVVTGGIACGAVVAVVADSIIVRRKKRATRAGSTR